jgi:D-alanyl-D-alanine endopeptidase (penicillin-binding protein 7)
VLIGLVGVEVPASFAQTAKASPAKQSTKTTAPAKTAAKPAAKRRPVYSASRSKSRKAALARARATATAREIANTVLPRYKVDASGDLVPDLRAAAAIILNPETGEVLWEENSQSQRSIASITKVMTAVVFLESNPDPMQEVTIVRGDVYQASTTKLMANDRVTVDDLLHLLLIPSDNAAARALARISPQGSAGFIDRMNAKAAEMGLTSTRYADPSGLLSDNVSSAYDMARLIAYASADDRISSIMRTPEYTVHTAKRSLELHSTNHLLGNGDFDGITCSAMATLTCAPARPASSPRPVIVWRRCSACPRAGSRSPLSSSARGPMPDAFSRRKTCSAGCRTKRRRCSPSRRSPRPSSSHPTYPR